MTFQMVEVAVSLGLPGVAQESGASLVDPKLEAVGQWVIVLDNLAGLLSSGLSPHAARRPSSGC